MGRKTALVTGASSGLGIDLARQLASRGYDLALTARSAAPMERLASDIRREHGVAASVHPLDLSAANSAADLVSLLDKDGIVPDVLVNNAAFGLSESFVDHDPARLRAMLQLNMISLSELTLMLGRRMRDAGAGHILLVSSTAAYQPAPMMAAYAASKAFILSLGEALNVELAPEVGVTVSCPGLMETGFNIASGYKPTSAIRRFMMPTEAVVKASLDGLFAGRSSVVPGRMNALAAFSNRLMSRRAAARLFLKMSRER